jgi:hypothetical protein
MVIIFVKRLFTVFVMFIVALAFGSASWCLCSGDIDCNVAGSPSASTICGVDNKPATAALLFRQYSSDDCCSGCFKTIGDCNIEPREELSFKAGHATMAPVVFLLSAMHALCDRGQVRLERGPPVSYEGSKIYLKNMSLLI